MTLFKVNDNLHNGDKDAEFARTHVGQAHLAGTGPAGKTCRDCALYGFRNRTGTILNPGYYEANGQLKQGRCNHTIPGKANRVFPHTAGACSLFQQTEQPFPLSEKDAAR